MTRLLLGMLWACACCYVALAHANPLGSLIHGFLVVVTGGAA